MRRDSSCPPGDKDARDTAPPHPADQVGVAGGDTRPASTDLVDLRTEA